MKPPPRKKSTLDNIRRYVESFKYFSWGDDTDEGVGKIVIAGKRGLPAGFPIAIVEFTQSGRALANNALFRRKFFAESIENDDLFRRKADPECVLTEIINPEALRGNLTDEDRGFGRIDFFYQWESGRENDEFPLKIRYPKDLEEDPNLATRAKFVNERYFRYWITERDYEDDGEKVYVACFIDITSEEKYRLALEDAERDFASRLSERLVHRAFRNTGAFALETRPMNGESRAGGDFFVLWPLARKNKSDLVLVMIGDAAGKALIAASVVQLVASILRGIGGMYEADLLHDDDAPALQIIEILSSEIAETSVFRVAGLDGIVLVLDFESNSLHWAEGKFGAFILSPDDPASLDTIGLPPGLSCDQNEATHPPIYGRKNPKFTFGKSTLGADDVIIGATDGLRGIVSAGSGPEDLARRLIEQCRNAANMPDDGRVDATRASETETDSAVALDDPYLRAIVTEMFRYAGDDQDDDQLAVAVSVRRLKDALEQHEDGDGGQ